MLIPTRNLQGIALSTLTDYSLDNASAIAFERPFRRWIAVIVIGAFFGWPIIAIIAYSQGHALANKFAPWLIVIPFITSYVMAISCIAKLARKTPLSTKSGRPMDTYLRTDGPSGVVQFVYVCHSSKTYFTRNFSVPGMP